MASCSLLQLSFYMNVHVYECVLPLLHGGLKAVNLRLRSPSDILQACNDSISI